MAKISQRLITLPDDLAKLVIFATKKKMGSVSAVREMDGNRASQWIIRLSALADPIAGPESKVQHVTIFTRGIPGEEHSIYIDNKPKQVPLSEISDWIMDQEGAFPDATASKLISGAVANGWTFSTRYSDYSRMPSGAMPDRLELRAGAHNFNRPGWFRAEILASINADTPEWNKYWYIPSGDMDMPADLGLSTLSVVQDLLGNLAPTLPKKVAPTSEASSETSVTETQDPR